MNSSASSLRRRLWSECSRVARSNSRRFSSESASTSSSSASSASESSEVPGVALLLGATGAIPFLALTPQLQPHVSPFLPPFVRENAASLQVGYGVAIASFLGGIHWGLAASKVAWGARGAAATASAAVASGATASPSATAARYLWSVTPCLLAWPATALVSGDGNGKATAEDEAKAAGLAAATLAAAVAVDASFASKGLLPPYLMKLRVPLSAAAVGGLALRAADANGRSEKRG